MDLPPAPYKVAGGTHQVPGVLDVVFIAEATVHPRTDQHSGWTAMTCLASLNERLADDFDLDDDSVSTYGSSPARSTAAPHRGGPGRCRRPRRRRAQRGAGDRAGELRDHRTTQPVRRRHRDPGPSDDGSVVVAFSSVPDDASKEIRTLAAASLDSLRVN